MYPKRKMYNVQYWNSYYNEWFTILSTDYYSVALQKKDQIESTNMRCRVVDGYFDTVLYETAEE